MLLALSACNKVETEIQPVPGEEGITITATLAPKGANTKAVADGGDKITVTWAVNEHIAILYEVSSTKYVADATITAVDGTTGSATITFTVEAGTANDTPCTLVYPLSAAKDDHTGVKDAATLLAAQDGTLNANLDVRVGEGTIQTTTPGLTVSTQPEAQFAIFKFTVKNSDASATIDVKPLTVTIGAQDYVITPASATSELFVALPAIASQAVTFTATGSDGKIYTASKPSVSFDAGKYYQSPLKMTAAGLADVISRYLRTFIGADGFIYATTAAATAAGTTAVAKIVYVGSDNGESAPYNHGLALALSDANGGSYLEWSTSSTKVHTYNPTSSSFESESGLQYNATHNSDTYPAFKAAITYSPAAPTGCSAWFLASGYQWQKMAGAVGGYINLGLKLYRVYWSSTEYSANKAWYFDYPDGNWYNDSKGYGNLVRACLAF